MANFNAESLRARAKVANAEGDVSEKADFIAEPLTVTVTRPDGTIVMQCDMEARGFKATESKKGPTKGQMLGGVGWYADIKAKDGAVYDDFALSAGLRISLAGIKLDPADSLDLTQSASE